MKEGIATEIAQKDGLIPEERKDELIGAGLDFFRVVRLKYWLASAFIVWVLFCSLPSIAQFAHWESLGFLLNLYVIRFPGIVAWIAGGLSIAAIPLQFTERLRVNRGGCRDEHHTVILIKEGLFGVVRNPEYTFHICLYVLLPIALSFLLRYTILSIIGTVLAISSYVLLAKREEAFNIAKWGDEYRRYMREVPRFNILLGLWRLIFKR
jgi:protein-S-isoprenylcysteine O-methyltransferase Ste14